MPPGSLVSKLQVRQMLLVALILVPALALLVLQAFSERRTAEAALVQDAYLFSARVGMSSKEFLPDPETYLSRLASMPELLAGGSRCNELMQTWLRADYFFHNLFLVSFTGDLTCSGRPLTTSLTVSDRAYFKRAVATKKFSIGNFQKTSDGTQIIVFLVPIVDASGQVLAFVGASAQLDWFQRAFEKAVSTTALSSVSAAAIDEDGTVMASSGVHLSVGAAMPGWGATTAQIAKHGLYVRKETVRGGIDVTTTYLALYRSDSANIYLRVDIPQTEALAKVAHDSRRRLAFLILFAAVAATAAWWVSSWLVTEPIKRLKETAMQLGSGRLHVRTGISHSNGEIGELAQNFDAMAQRLEEQHASLSRLTRLKVLRGQVNAAALRAKDESALLQAACESIRAGGGFHAVLIVDQAGLRAWSAVDDGVAAYLAAHGWPHAPAARDPIHSAIATGEVRIARNIGDGPQDAWLGLPMALGCSAAIGLPIASASGIVGGLGIFSLRPDDFDADQVQMLVETANDLGVGIGVFRSDRQLKESRNLLRMIVDNIPTMIFAKDAKDFSFVSMNRVGERLLGKPEAEILGKTDFDLFPESEASYFRRMDQAALRADKDFVVTDEPINTAAGETRLLETRKLRLLAEDGHPKYLLGISEDITERRRTEQQLKYLAEHDQLTGLLNRYGLLRHFEMHAASIDKEAPITIALYVDLDGFKEINDTLGHRVGDELLRTVASLLQTAHRENHTVARVGGDEFIITMRDQKSTAYAIELAERIRERCEKPFYVQEHEIYISVSIGVSSVAGKLTSADELLHSADIAMYQAKAQGRNRYAIYSPDMQSEVADKLAMRNQLRHAIDHHELSVHYQPRVSVKSGKIVGAEALLRWNNKLLGPVSPGVFIPLAEDSGLILPIGEWVLRQACLQAKRWQMLLTAPFRMAVNLSPRQLRQSGLVEMIRSVLSDTGLEAASLELEITESAIMDRGTKSIDVLHELADMGIHLAVDDFGTGYSNLSYLKQLPLDVLKVDQSFVRGVANDSNDLVLVTAIVAMATSLSLSVTAEGIETVQQLDIMQSLGITDYQGFLFAKAMPASEFADQLRGAGDGTNDSGG